MMKRSKFKFSGELFLEFSVLLVERILFDSFMNKFSYLLIDFEGELKVFV